MSRMTFSPTTSRRDLARLRHRSRPHNVAHLRHRQLQAERLEDRRLLAYADFELSSLLPANGGDGSTGFVVSGITDGGKLGYPISNSQPLGDVNQDGIDDFLLSAPGTNGGTAAGQAYVIFGRAGGGFPAELDLTTLDGTNGYVIDGVSPILRCRHFRGRGRRHEPRRFPGYCHHGGRASARWQCPARRPDIRALWRHAPIWLHSTLPTAPRMDGSSFPLSMRRLPTARTDL